MPADRAAPWVLLITGAGLRGRAERRLRDRAAGFYGAPVPVEVHHYGVLRSGALLRWSQRLATRRLGARLRELAGRHGPPDVVAHSFGGWLLGQVLRENPDLRVGRVVLAGSVLPPDFDWARLLAAGQVEAVLNHYSRRDGWAWLSQFFIPGSGPSGRRGFLACPGVVNHPEARYRHASFFAARRIAAVHRDVWVPFLTRPVVDLASTDHPPGWRPVPWLLRARLGRVLIGIALLAGAAGVVRLLTTVEPAGVLAAAYLAGAVPVSYLVARLRGLDLRAVGSGSPTPWNLYRSAGPWPALLAGAGEVAKGTVGPLLAGAGRPWLGAAAGALAVVAHNWSPVLRGTGGRGLSTATGALCVLAWPGAAVMCAGLLTSVLTRRVLPAMSVALFALVPVLLWTGGTRAAWTGVLVAAPIGAKTFAVLRSGRASRSRGGARSARVST